MIRTFSETLPANSNRQANLRANRRTMFVWGNGGCGKLGVELVTDAGIVTLTES